MAVFYCKLISTEFSPSAEDQIKAFINNALGEVNYQPFIPYWKNPLQGELSFSFSAVHSLSEIQSLFADRWQMDSADTRWSTIFCPSISFIWLSQ
jgi:hypothetical protein